MRAAGARFLLAAGVALSAVAGCAAPFDDDGEVRGAPPHPATPAAADAIPVVVDTDLGGDDLVALAFLLRHPAVEVEAVTVAATGLVGCEAGMRVVAGLFHALQEAPTPVACGRASAGPGGAAFPAAWREVAEAGSGIRPMDATPDARDAVTLIADQARATKRLVVVALGPLTNVADLAQAHPDDYRRLAGVHAMAGSVAGPLVDGVAEWNAVADPDALATVLAAPAPLTVVPEDAVPPWTPRALRGPVVASVAATVDYPKWWDLAATAALVAPEAGEWETGAWSLDDSEPGRLRRDGDGSVRTYRTLRMAALEAAYDEGVAW